MRELRELKILEEERSDDDPFLRIRRLRLQNLYDDGSSSRPYACDIVSRRHRDAVAIVLFDRRGKDGAVRVALREGLRPPIVLRPDADDGLLAEIVAGMIEPGDEVDERAVAEVEEEAGIRVPVAAIRPLGGPHHPSPGISDECVHFRAVEHDLDDRREARGDGSAMEEVGRLIVLPLEEALARCRSGHIRDMKTEVGLARLAAELQVEAEAGS